MARPRRRRQRLPLPGSQPRLFQTYRTHCHPFAPFPHLLHRSRKTLDAGTDRARRGADVLAARGPASTLPPAADALAHIGPMRRTGACCGRVSRAVLRASGCFELAVGVPLTPPIKACSWGDERATAPAGSNRAAPHRSGSVGGPPPAVKPPTVVRPGRQRPTGRCAAASPQPSRNHGPAPDATAPASTAGPTAGRPAKRRRHRHQRRGHRGAAPAGVITSRLVHRALVPAGHRAGAGRAARRCGTAGARSCCARWARPGATRCSG